MKGWLFLVIAIVGEVIATSALKSSEGFTKLAPSAVVIIGYGIAFYFLSLVLKSIPVGVAYAVWSGLGVVIITAIAWLLHGQKLDAWGFVGMGLIIAAFLLARSPSWNPWGVRRHAHLALVHTSIEHSRDWCRSLLILNCQELAAQQPLRPINWCSRLLKMTQR